MSATVDHRYWGHITRPVHGVPALCVHQLVKLDCGCGYMIGKRMDNRELAGAPFHCKPNTHAELMRFFCLSLQESLVEPQARPFVDVVVELLDNAERVMGDG